MKLSEKGQSDLHYHDPHQGHDQVVKKGHLLEPFSLQVDVLGSGHIQKFDNPAGLSSIQFLWLAKIAKVSMVRIDSNREGSILKIVSPFFKGLNHS